MCLMEKLPGASLHPRWYRFSPRREVVLHRMSLPGGTILNPQSSTLNPLPLPLLLPSALRITLQWDGLHVYMNMIRAVNIFLFFYPFVTKRD